LPNDRRHRLHQIATDLASLPQYEGFDTLSNLSNRQQIAWILQRTNRRLRAALGTLVRAGDETGLSAYRRRKALLEVLATVYLRPADRNAIVDNAEWCARLAEQDDRAAVRDATRRIMTEMFDRSLVAPTANIEQARLFVWAVDEGLASGRRVWDRELLIHCYCSLAQRARHDDSAGTSLFWLDRARLALDSLGRPDPWIEVRVGGSRALTLAAAGRLTEAAAMAIEFASRATHIGSERWADRLEALLDKLGEPSSWRRDDT